jgi:Leucine-rich repeat (LRR) protein
MPLASAHNAYRELEAAHAAAGKVVEKALQSGDLRALRSSTEQLKRTTAEFREALERDVVEVPGKGRLFRAEHEALQQLARENQVDFSGVLDGIRKIEGGRVRKLDLTWRCLSAVRALAGLTGLSELYLTNNQLTDITALTKLTGLTRLDLRNNRLTDITPLAKLTGLTWLELGDNYLTNITPLKNLAGLAEIYIYNNPLTNRSTRPVLAALEENGCVVWR